MREWLDAMVVGRIVEYDPENETYYLPQKHAAFLTRVASPDNIAVTTQFIPLMGSVEDGIVESFKHGGGLPYSSFPHFHEVMTEDSGQTVVAALTDHILPLVPGLSEQLEEGIDVLDVGCDSGHSPAALVAPLAEEGQGDLERPRIVASRMRLGSRACFLLHGRDHKPGRC